MVIEPDILERIFTDFGPADRQFVIDAICSTYLGGRTVRCILFASCGSIDRFRDLLSLADLDDREVIVAGEYEMHRRVRDLRVAFLINSPNDFWISDVAISVHKHGYRLKNLKTRVVSTPPYAGVRTEGTATFDNGNRSIGIERQGATWSIRVDDCNLAKFGLDLPLSDEERFRIQLDYLLSRIDAEQADEP